MHDLVTPPNQLPFSEVIALLLLSDTTGYYLGD